jgi:hypothetical protein
VDDALARIKYKETREIVKRAHGALEAAALASPQLAREEGA